MFCPVRWLFVVFRGSCLALRSQGNSLLRSALVCGLCTCVFVCFALPLGVIGRLYSVIVPLPVHLLYYFNDRFYLSFFFAMRGFRWSGFDYYWTSHLSALKSRPNVFCITQLKRYSYDSCLNYGSSLHMCCLDKPALIHVRTTMVQISLRFRADWSAPLFFTIARSSFDGEASHELKLRAKWFWGIY